MEKPQSDSKCPECFQPIHPHATKCSHCTADIFHCPHCKTQVTVNVKYFRTSDWSWDESAMLYCTRCGNKIGGPEKSLMADHCFIATAAYGTPTAPEVNILRHMRDKQISRYTLGRAFIKAYESISPPIAKYISGRNILRLFIRIGLSPIVFVCKLLRRFQS